MHILLANNIYPPIMAGGAELIVSYLAEGLVRHGHQVTVVSTCGPDMEPYPDEVRNGVTVIRFFPKNLYWHWQRAEKPAYAKALWHLRDAWNRDAGRRFSGILAQRRPDILHTHVIDGMTAILWRRARQAGLPTIHTAHDYHLLCPRALLLSKSLKLCTQPSLPCKAYRSWHIRTTRDIDLFCSPSQFLLDKHKQAGLAAANNAIVRNGIPLPAMPEKPPAHPCHFLFPARLTTEKGCDVVLQALRLLPADVPFALTVAGKGDYAEKFQAAAARDPRIRFLGYIQDAQKHAAFASAHWLLMPSLWYENAPVAIIEAAAYGLGVIGSNIGAIPEFIHHEKTGLLFEPGNPHALAEAILRAVQDPTLLTHLPENTRQLLQSSSVETMVDNYARHYETLTAS